MTLEASSGPTETKNKIVLKEHELYDLLEENLIETLEVYEIHLCLLNRTTLEFEVLEGAEFEETLPMILKDALDTMLDRITDPVST